MCCLSAENWWDWPQWYPHQHAAAPSKRALPAHPRQRQRPEDDGPENVNKAKSAPAEVKGNSKLLCFYILLHIFLTFIYKMPSSSLAVKKYTGATNYRERIYSTFTPCGNFIFSGSEDGMAYVWNTDTGKDLVLPCDKEESWNRGGVNCLLFWLPRWPGCSLLWALLPHCPPRRVLPPSREHGGFLRLRSEPASPRVPVRPQRSVKTPDKYDLSPVDPAPEYFMNSQCNYIELQLCLTVAHSVPAGSAQHQGNEQIHVCRHQNCHQHTWSRSVTGQICCFSHGSVCPNSKTRTENAVC